MRQYISIALFACAIVIALAQCKTKPVEYALNLGDKKIVFEMRQLHIAQRFEGRFDSIVVDSLKMFIGGWYNTDELVIDELTYVVPRDSHWTTEENGEVIYTSSIIKDSLFTRSVLFQQDTSTKRVQVSQTFFDTIWGINPITLEEEFEVSPRNFIEVLADLGSVSRQDLQKKFSSDIYLEGGGKNLQVDSIWFDFYNERDYGGFSLIYKSANEEAMEKVRSLEAGTFLFLSHFHVVSPDLDVNTYSSRVLIRLVD